MLEDQLYDINQKVTSIVMGEMTEVLPEDLGLDRRAGYRFYVTKDAIAVRVDNDRTLQYYGGFEYVDKESRVQYGEWVFYMASDERVVDHLAQYYDDETEEETE